LESKTSFYTGLTNESILPQQAKEAQISLPDLFDNAIILALQKHNNK
jgi:D-alanine-D-alanine ligase